MRRLALWLMLACSAVAQTRLDQLVEQQRLAYPAASVTSGYYEARGLSRYRSSPGLHAGYDIAMPAGSAARAAWPGSVRAVIPWAEGEWGVEVLHQDGTTATYGHIVPAVGLGDRISIGQTVGSIARDHLDVKMRDAQGQLFDYASGLYLRQATVPVQPDFPALSFQQQLRQMKDRPEADRKNWEALKRSGLTVDAAPQGTDLAKLERLARAISSARLQRLTWTPEDLSQARFFQKQAEAMEYRYGLGLVSRKQRNEARRRARLWNRTYLFSGSQ